MFDFLGALAKTLCIQEKLFFVQMKYKDCRRHGLLDFFLILAYYNHFNGFIGGFKDPVLQLTFYLFK